MGRRIVLAAVLLFLVGPASAAGPLAFAVQLEGGAFKQYRLDKTRTISDDVLDATATDVAYPDRRYRSSRSPLRARADC